ncbi:MAG: hypothetical protein C4329_13840 [Chitinophagaceae bacterium]
MNEKHFEVIIIGGGAAGLMASLELVKIGKKLPLLKPGIILGGRAHNIYDPSFELPVESGAEFIHDNLKLALDLLKQAGIDYYKVEGEMWQKKIGQLKNKQTLLKIINC